MSPDGEERRPRDTGDGDLEAGSATGPVSCERLGDDASQSDLAYVSDKTWESAFCRQVKAALSPALFRQAAHVNVLLRKRDLDLSFTKGAVDRHVQGVGPRREFAGGNMAREPKGERVDGARALLAWSAIDRRDELRGCIGDREVFCAAPLDAPSLFVVRVERHVDGDAHTEAGNLGAKSVRPCSRAALVEQ